MGILFPLHFTASVVIPYKSILGTVWGGIYGPILFSGTMFSLLLTFWTSTGLVSLWLNPQGCWHEVHNYKVRSRQEQGRSAFIFKFWIQVGENRKRNEWIAFAIHNSTAHICIYFLWGYSILALVCDSGSIGRWDSGINLAFNVDEAN